MKRKDAGQRVADRFRGRVKEVVGAGEPGGGISNRVRAEALWRDGFTCQSCGHAAADIDPQTGCRVVLRVVPTEGRAHGGAHALEDLISLCTRCLRNPRRPTPKEADAIWLLSQIRRAAPEDQRRVLRWLRNRLGEAAGDPP